MKSYLILIGKTKFNVYGNKNFSDPYILHEFLLKYYANYVRSKKMQMKVLRNDYIIN